LLVRLFKTLYAPPVVFSAIWTIGIALHYIFSFTLLPDLLPLSSVTYILFTSGSLCFGLGSFLSAIVFSKPQVKNENLLKSGNTLPVALKLRLILVLITLLVLPFYVKKAIEIVVSSEIENFLVGLRNELSVGDADYGWYKYIITLSIITFSLCLFESIKKPTIVNRIILLISFLITVGYVVLFTGRTFFLLIFLNYCFANLLLNPKFKIKRLLVLIPLALLTFILLGLLLNKGGSFDDSLRDNVKSSSELTAVYVVGAFSAFEYESDKLVSVANMGINSLRFFYLIGDKLGFIIPPEFKASLVQDFVYVPYETNVYTYYSPYYRDFGYLYPLICLILFGFIHMLVFIKAKETKNPKMILYYSLLMYPLTMSIFSDNYLTLTSSWIQFVIYIEGISFLNRFFFKPKDVSVHGI
jgi:oligosaccharide repeat unit polymerase